MQPIATLCGLLLATSLLPAQETSASRRAPNVVLILADDLGYGDVHALNPESDLPTPNLDRLAAEGMVFTDAHSPSAVCTPTRYGLLTGRYCWRTALKSGVLGGYSPPLLEPGRPTLGTLFQDVGFRTAAIGKWHLGMTLPMRDGIDDPELGKWPGDPGIDFTGQISDGPLQHGYPRGDPGRLIDLLNQEALTLEAARFLVLDEADQMLDMGFIHDLRRIVNFLPEQRQTMLFSATMPKLMAEIADGYLSDPVKVQVSPPGKAADKITQSVHFIAKAEKNSLLIELLDEHRDEAALVFCRTKHGAERLAKGLDKRGFATASVHGNKSQGQRERAIAALRSGEVRVLVATDVAARGLDIPVVRHVYNYDLPNVPDSYVHRIGRTARAGADGSAVAFCAPDEMDELKAIEKTMKKSIPVASGRPWQSYEQVEKPKPGGGRRRGGGGGGGRPSGKPAAGPGKPGGGNRRRRRPGGRGKGGPRAA